MHITPITLREANDFIEQHHRHHGPVRGWLCGAAVSVAGDVVGVAIAGRPSARHLQDGWTAEVTRCCVLPSAPKGACSKLYATLWRACRALGYCKIVTYTLPSESGASLRGAGWKVVHQTKAESWHRKERPRIDQPLQAKLRWEVKAG